MSFRQSGKPVSFLYVGERERALAFYRDTLGFTVSDSDQYGDFLDLGPALVRLTVMPDLKPHAHPVLGWDVEHIESAVKALRDRGIAFTIYDGFGQDELGIWTAPDGSKLAFFADPDGNVLTLSQS